MPLIGFAFALALTAMADVEVHLAPDATAARCMKSGWVAARNSDGQGLVRVPIREDQRTYRLQISGESIWEITTEIEGCWSEAAHRPSDGGVLSLALHRAATVSGVFESDANPAGELRGFLFPLRSGGAGQSLGESGLSTRCQLDFPRWQCSVPADVPLDLRLELPGFGAVHYFGVAAAEGAAKKLPPQRLLAGATLSGWVQDAERVAVPNARLTLYPMQAEMRIDETRRYAVRRHLATANAKGFFQLAGLEPGVYRLVSEVKGLSPVNIPEVRLREGESLVWPRPIVHPPVARLEVVLSPPLDSSGSPWVVELQEKAPLHLDHAPPLQRKASPDGQWEADALRADVYRLRVNDRHGSTLESMTVDLSEGGLQTITVDVRSIAVRGILLMGDEPLSGYLYFTNHSGKNVEARAGKDGLFSAVFPTGGKWMPRLEYPRQGAGAVRLAPVNIELERDASEPLELHVPGGRIRGQVVTPQKTPKAAAVHILRDTVGLVAQVVTANDGMFDFIGIAPGSYTIQASGDRLATERPMPLEVDKDETKELTLVLAPTRRVEVVILTPFGTPASGAAVQLSSDGGKTWPWLSADAAGRLERSVPSGAGDVLLVVATYAWPSAAVRVPAEMLGPVTIRLLPEGGALRVRNAPFPVVRGPDLTAPFGAFKIPPPQSRREDPALMEPGTYVVCPDHKAAADACRSVTIGPGTQQTIDFAPTDEKEKSGS